MRKIRIINYQFLYLFAGCLFTIGATAVIIVNSDFSLFGCFIPLNKLDTRLYYKFSRVLISFDLICIFLEFRQYAHLRFTVWFSGFGVTLLSVCLSFHFVYFSESQIQWDKERKLYFYLCKSIKSFIKLFVEILLWATLCRAISTGSHF